MQYRELGRTGMHVSALGVGSNRLRRCTQAETTALLNRALDLGINYISTGAMYGTEEMIGKAISRRREEYYLASKGGQYTAQAEREALDGSLRRLQADYLDLYEIDCVNTEAHMAQHFGPGGSYEALLKARDEGLIRHIGITSHRPDYAVRMMRLAPLDTAATMISIVQPYASSEVLPVARSLGVGTISIRPLDHGSLVPRGRAMAFAIRSGVDVTLSGMTSVAQVEENVALTERALAMSDEEVAALQAEAAALPRNGCRNCGQCRCPHELRIAFALPLYHYRQRYGLGDSGDGPQRDPSGQQMWARNAERARIAAEHCATCRQCEAMCAYGVPIIEYVRRIAAESAPHGSG
jgi:aryl-alcohol dehydrogenase-like predicted oxidoreductase